jgi:hypothetical protein
VSTSDITGAAAPHFDWPNRHRLARVVRGRLISPGEWSRWNVSLRLAVAPAWPAEQLCVETLDVPRAALLDVSGLGTDNRDPFYARSVGQPSLSRSWSEIPRAGQKGQP